jgi:DNA-binding MarR family transcriptional regulator
MPFDIIDQMQAAWRRERPDLDPTPVEIVGRAIVIAAHLERSVQAALAEHDLSLGQFDILATLRRQGPAGELTPTQLLRCVMLSSGGMTSRLDRLEKNGLVTRRSDPDDRRGVVVRLTEKGRKRIDEATEARFREARRSLPALSRTEAAILTELLRKWLIQLTGEQP